MRFMSGEEGSSRIQAIVDASSIVWISSCIYKMKKR